MMMFKKILGLAQKVLCLGLCVSLLGTSGFYGVAHASDEAWLAPNATDRVGIWKESGETVVHVDPNNRNKPYSGIRVTGDNSHVIGVDVREYGADGILYVTKGCQIVATKTGTTDTTGPRGIHLDGDTTTQGSIKFTNDISVSSLDNSGLSGAKGISLQNIIMNMDGHNLTVSEVKGSNKGCAAGIDLYSSTSSVDCSLTTNGGNIEVKNVSANGTGDATSSDMAVGVSLNKGSKITTNRGNLTIKNVSSAFNGVKQGSGFYGSARGLALYNGSSLELINQGDTTSGVLTIDGVTATGTNSVAIGYDIHNATDKHQGPVVIRNVKATGTNGKAVAISVTADASKTAELTLGYGIRDSQEYLTGSNYGIEGDVVAAKGDGTATASIRMALQGYSVLKGNLLTTDPTGLNSTAGTIDLHLLSGGRWFPVFDTSNAAIAETNTTVKLSEGGVVDMAYTGLDTSGSIPVASYGQRDARTLTLNKLEADGGAFIVNTDINANQADKIVLNNVTDSASKGIKVLVAHDPVMDAIKIPSATKIDLETPIEIVKVNGGSLTKVEGGKFKVSKGANSYETEATFEQSGDDWGLKSLSFKLLGLSPTAIATRSVAKAIGLSFINITNTLQKRLGDLRSGAGSNIGWVRFMRTNNYTDDIKLNGNQYQVGYDRQISSDDISKRYFGVAIDQYDGNNSFDSGNSDVKSTTLGVYYTRMFESGHYYDFIFRYGRTYGDWTSFDASLPSPVTTADFGVNSVSISGEYGYRWNIGKAGFYIEPQVELIAGYVSSSNNRTSAGDLVYMDSTRHFITRGGIAFGQRAKNLNYYLRFSYNHDFAGDLNVDFAGENIKSESPKNWLDATLGLGWLMKDNCYLYGEVSKNYKDITNSLNFNVGFRITL